MLIYAVLFIFGLAIGFLVQRVLIKELLEKQQAIIADKEQIIYALQQFADHAEYKKVKVPVAPKKQSKPTTAKKKPSPVKVSSRKRSQ